MSAAPNLEIDYVIAVVTAGAKGFRWTVTGTFSSRAWNRLWTELRVPQERWDAWQAAHGNLIVLPEFPNLSQLAHLDEGTISLDPQGIQQECSRALAVARDSDVRSMLEQLQRSAISAN